jgi:hypothetical protein
MLRIIETIAWLRTEEDSGERTGIHGEPYGIGCGA